MQSYEAKHNHLSRKTARPRVSSARWLGVGLASLVAACGPAPRSEPVESPSGATKKAAADPASVTGAHVDDPSAITGSAGVDGTADPAKPKPFSAAEMPGDPCDVLPHDAASQRAYDRCRESYRTSWLEFIAGTHAHVKHNDKFSKRAVRKVIDGAAQNVDGWRFFVVVPDPPPDLVTDSVRIEVGGVTPTPNPNYRRYIFEPAQAFVIQVGLFDDQIAPGVHRVLVTAEDGTPLFDREVELSASKSAR